MSPAVTGRSGGMLRPSVPSILATNSLTSAISYPALNRVVEKCSGCQSLIPAPQLARPRRLPQPSSWRKPLAGVVQQRLGAAWVAQLGQRLLLQLPDPLPGQPEDLTDLVQGVRVPVIQAEPHGHDGRLARGQRVQRTPELVGHQLAVDELRRCRRVHVLDQVPDARLAILADRGVQAERLTAGAQQFLDLIRRPVELDRKLLGGWLPAELLVRVAC